MCASIKHSAQACVDIKKRGETKVIWSSQISSAAVVFFCALLRQVLLNRAGRSLWCTDTNLEPLPPFPTGREGQAQPTALIRLVRSYFWCLLGSLRMLKWPVETLASGECSSLCYGVAFSGVMQGERGWENVEWSSSPAGVIFQALARWLHIAHPWYISLTTWEQCICGQ